MHLKVDSENVPPLFNLVENYFITIRKIKEENQKQLLPARLVPLCITNKIVQELSMEPDVIYHTFKKDKHKITFRMIACVILKTIKLRSLALSKNEKKLIKSSQKFKYCLSEYHRKALELKPMIEGRIRIEQTSTQQSSEAVCKTKV